MHSMTMSLENTQHNSYFFNVDQSTMTAKIAITIFALTLKSNF